MAKLGKWIDGLAPDDRIVDVAAQTLQARLTAVEYYLPLAAETAEENVEFVHQLRVSTRRARAAMDLYHELLPPKRALRMKNKLNRIRDAAGEARDCDVLIGRLTGGDDLNGVNGRVERILKRLRKQRRAAQAPIEETFERLAYKQKFHRRGEQLLSRIRPRGTKSALNSGNPKFRQWAPTAFAPIVHRFLDATPGAEHRLEDLHRFRIRGKGLRYAMELLSAAYPPEFRDELYPKLGELQEKLGEVNDHSSAITRYTYYVEESTHKSERKFFRQLLEQEEQLAAASQAAFWEWWTPEFHNDIAARLKAYCG